MAETLYASGRFGERLASWSGRHLAEVRDDLDDAPALQERIRAQRRRRRARCSTPPRPELAAIRKRLRTAQDRVRERLNTMLRSTDTGRRDRRGDRDAARRPLRDPDSRRRRRDG